MSPTETLSWLAPSPVWGQGGFGVDEQGFLEPWIAEFKSDQFIPEFLALMSGEGNGTASQLAGYKPSVPDLTTGYLRLYQPLHQRYYLVTTSLVCRRAGIPDRAVATAHGERTSFLMRRRPPDGTEQAWIPAISTWHPVAPGGPPLPGEERLPLHAVPVAPFADPSSVAGTLGLSGAGRRSVLYGYIPAGRRERLVPPMDPAAAAAALQAMNQDKTPGAVHEDPRFDELLIRFLLPWLDLLQAPPTLDTIATGSLYLILDLADWLSRWLPDLYAALPSGTLPSGAALPAALQTLFDAMDKDKIPGTPPEPEKTGIRVWKSDGTVISLRQALVELKDLAPLVTGADKPFPKIMYNLRPFVADPSTEPVTGIIGDWLTAGTTVAPGKGNFAKDAIAALGDPGKVALPKDLEGLIKDDPAPGTNGAGDRFVIYAVYEHAPCRPVVSRPSRIFTLAPAMDPDAPARKIRIQLPDINHMRRFSRGVALEMPPSLRRVVDRVHKGMLKGEDLGPDPGLELGMICSFSLQIIFLVAFIVMFIFLILFNIIFWWLPFLKICFPIPRKPRGS